MGGKQGWFSVRLVAACAGLALLPILGHAVDASRSTPPLEASLPPDDGPVIASIIAAPVPVPVADRVNMVVVVQLLGRNGKGNHVVALQRMALDPATGQWSDDPGADNAVVLLGACESVVNTSDSYNRCSVGDQPTTVIMTYAVPKPDGAIYLEIDGLTVIGAGASETRGNSAASKGLVKSFLEEADIRAMLRQAESNSALTGVQSNSSLDGSDLVGNP